MNKKKIVEFFKENKWFFLKVGVLMLPTAVGFANDASSIEITPLQGPLTKVIKFVTGPLAGTVTVASLVTGISSYQMGWDQNITKKAGVGVVCGGACTQVDSLCQSLGIIASSCTF